MNKLVNLFILLERIFLEITKNNSKTTIPNKLQAENINLTKLPKLSVTSYKSKKKN